MKLYGQGKCAVCGCSIRKGLLMCAPDWADVPAPLKSEVYGALHDWNQNIGTLGDLQEVQERAIGAVTGHG